MKVYHSIYDFDRTCKTIVTLGSFDGVHLGHREILNRLENNVKTTGAESLLLTFSPHPRSVINPEYHMSLLNTLAEKSELLEAKGLDNLVVHKFDSKFASLSPEKFVREILVDKFNLSKIIIGHDHRFGKDRAADFKDLISFGQKYGFEVEEISAREINNISVSSSKIRTALNEGNISLANKYLDYNYYFSGEVIHGKKLGKKLGFPTANISIPEPYKLMPKIGVYIVSSVINGEFVKGMMSVGYNPTFENHPYSIEVHYLDWEGDLYGKTLKVSILERIRDEKKFDSLESLIENIKSDETATRTYFIDKY